MINVIFTSVIGRIAAQNDPGGSPELGSAKDLTS